MSSESDRIFEKYKRDSGAVQIGEDSPQTIEEAQEWANSSVKVVALVGAVSLILLAAQL